MTPALKIRPDDWIVFSTSMNYLTYSKVTKPIRHERALRSTIQTLDGKVFRRLVVAAYPSVREAREHAARFNEGE